MSYVLRSCTTFQYKTINNVKYVIESNICCGIILIQKKNNYKVIKIKMIPVVAFSYMFLINEYDEIYRELYMWIHSYIHKYNLEFRLKHFSFIQA